MCSVYVLSLFFIWHLEIRSWWEVPCIAHYCYLFRNAFKLPPFEIEVSLTFCLRLLSNEISVFHICTTV